jgi:hypothetical protein
MECVGSNFVENHEVDTCLFALQRIEENVVRQINNNRLSSVFIDSKFIVELLGIKLVEEDEQS